MSEKLDSKCHFISVSEKLDSQCHFISVSEKLDSKCQKVLKSYYPSDDGLCGLLLMILKKADSKKKLLDPKCKKN